MLTIAQASAKIKKYQTIVGLIYLLVVPLSYLALVLWRVPEFVFVVNLLVFLVLQIVKMFIVCPIVKMWHNFILTNSSHDGGINAFRNCVTIFYSFNDCGYLYYWIKLE